MTYILYSVDPGGEYIGLPMNLQNPPRTSIANRRKGKGRVPSFGKRDRHLSEGERPRERQITVPERQRHLSAKERERYPSGSDRDGHQSGSDRETGKPQGYSRKGAKVPKPYVKMATNLIFQKNMDFPCL